MDYNKHMEKRLEARVRTGVTKGFKIFFMIILAALLFFLAGYVLQLLWNWLMPYLFGLPEVSYWQGFGILILAKLLFGFGGHSSGGSKKADGSRKSSCDNRRWEEKNKWWYYDRFWKEEGQAAFEDYVNRRKEEDNSGDPEADDTGIQ